ncbi:MAG: NusG domain II-containing protein [Clostridium sp.]
MDDKMKIVKKWDVIIIIVLVMISFVPYIIFTYSQRNNTGEIYAVVSVAGEEYKKIRLDNHTTTEEFTVKTPEGFNIIRIEGSTIGVIDADCPDKVCILPGLVNKVGERLVCLPHKVVVEIKGTKIQESEEDFISR